MRKNDLWDRIEPLLMGVERPSRYINHEYNSRGVGCEDTEALVKVALLYPDTYELGQSNQAIGILYHLINACEDAQAERVYLPWVDMISLMRAHKIPLFTLESCCPVASYDLLGITLPHELAATNILEALDLADIPLRAQDRGNEDPVVLGGGPVAFNPEPLAPFFDAFVIGEGEEVMAEILAALAQAKRKGLSRDEKIAALGGIAGVYIPRFYAVDEAGVLRPQVRGALPRITKRVVRDLDAYPVVIDPVVPFADVTHDRLTVELLRGCSRGCRFCQAGMIYRPVRERSADTIVDAVTQGLKDTGFNEVSLMSLSSTDHSQITQILRRLGHLTAGTGISISIPSQRLDAFGVSMAQLVSGQRKTGLTFAPEAGTQQLRDRINKNVNDEDLIQAVSSAFSLGWRRCKLYFMIGLPGEQDSDIQGIADLANRAFAAAKDCVDSASRGAVRMTLSVAVFIPKPHTPFQWCGQITTQEMQRRIELLRSCGLDKGIDLNWHDPATSCIEAALSRADRTSANLIEHAWRAGARFDAWSDQFNKEFWTQAEEECGMSIDALAHKEFQQDDALAWDHIDSGVDKAFLALEYTRSLQGITSEDCSFDACINCGVCPDLDVDIRLGGERRG